MHSPLYISLPLIFVREEKNEEEEDIDEVGESLDWNGGKQFEHDQLKSTQIFLLSFSIKEHQLFFFLHIH